MSEPEIFYRKVGRGEFPHFGKGSHLIVVNDGWTYTRLNVEPDRAALLAATKLAHEKVVAIIVKASSAKYELHNDRVSSDPEYKAKVTKAWEAYCEIMGDDKPLGIWFPSASDVADQIINEMVKVANE